jgi:hypothetical protein
MKLSFFDKMFYPCTLEHKGNRSKPKAKRAKAVDRFHADYNHRRAALNY